MSARIAFLGLGLMGAPMARRLAEAGTDLVVWNRSREKAVPFRDIARIAETPMAAARETDAVFLCLTDADAVEAVVLGPAGLAEAGQLNRIVDFSTISPDRTRTIAGRIAEATGAAWVDAPVSGGVPGAEQGTLTIMAGGAAADVEAVRPLMAPLCARFTHMGPVGAGQVTKLANQIISGCTIAIVAEAIAFAEAAGIDATRLPEALAGGFADSAPFRLFAPRMAARDYSRSIGSSRLMLKDLDAVREAGRKVDAVLPMSSLAAELYRATARHGLADEDIAALVEVLSGDARKRN